LEDKSTPQTRCAPQTIPEPFLLSQKKKKTHSV